MCIVAVSFVGLVVVHLVCKLGFATTQSSITSGVAWAVVVLDVEVLRWSAALRLCLVARLSLFSF